MSPVNTNAEQTADGIVNQMRPVCKEKHVSRHVFYDSLKEFANS